MNPIPPDALNRIRKFFWFSLKTPVFDFTSIARGFPRQIPKISDTPLMQYFEFLFLNVLFTESYIPTESFCHTKQLGWRNSQSKMRFLIWASGLLLYLMPKSPGRSLKDIQALILDEPPKHVGVLITHPNPTDLSLLNVVRPTERHDVIDKVPATCSTTHDVSGVDIHNCSTRPAWTFFNRVKKLSVLNSGLFMKHGVNRSTGDEMREKKIKLPPKFEVSNGEGRSEFKIIFDQTTYPKPMLEVRQKIGGEWKKIQMDMTADRAKRLSEWVTRFYIPFANGEYRGWREG